MKYIITYCLICLCAVSAFAQQTPVITYNPVTKTVDKQIPFDVPFIIKIPSKSPALIDDAFRVEDFNKYVPLSSVIQDTLEVTYDKSNFYLRFAPVPPNTNFDFIYESKYDETELLKFFELGYKLYIEKYIIDLFKSINFYYPDDSFNKDSVSFFYLTSNIDIIYNESDILSIDGLSKQSKAVIKEKKPKVRKENNLKSFYEDKLSIHYYNIFNEGTYDIDGFIWDYYSLPKPLNSISFNEQKDAAMIQFIEIVSQDGKPLKNYIKGLDLFLPEKNDLIVSLPETSIIDRLKRMKRNINFLRVRLDETIKKYYITQDNTLEKEYLEELRKYLICVINKMISTYTIVEREYNAILDAVRQNDDLRIVRRAYLTTDIADLKTEAGLQVFPSVGYAFAFPRTEHRFRYYPSIFAGVRVTWKPVNKSLRNKDYNFLNCKCRCPLLCWDKILRFTSFEFAAAFDPARPDEYERLNSRLSLLAGINVRVLRYFYISGGGMLLRRVNPNPVITDTRWAVAPYVGVSLDLDVAKFFKSITGV